MPAHWILETPDAQFILAHGVLPHPDASALEAILDVWAGPKGNKVLSVAWVPEKPWRPPTVIRYTAGDWLRLLGCPQT